MKTYVALVLFFNLQFLQYCLAGKLRSEDFFGNMLQGIGTTLTAGMNPYLQQQAMPPPGVQPTLYQRKEAEATITALKNEEEITDVNTQARKLADTYKQIEQDIAAPLESKTAALKQERNMILKKLSVLTKQVRTEYDLLHKDRANFPIIIIAQNHDDEMRAEANRIDANGSLDALRGIRSPCAAFHKSRETQKKSLQAPASDNHLDIEAETLNKMSPQERINYDKEMADQSEREVKEIEDEIKSAEREAKIMQQGGMMPITA